MKTLQGANWAPRGWLLFYDLRLIWWALFSWRLNLARQGSARHTTQAHPAPWTFPSPALSCHQPSRAQKTMAHTGASGWDAPIPRRLQAKWIICICKTPLERCLAHQAIYNHLLNEYNKCTKTNGHNNANGETSVQSRAGDFSSNQSMMLGKKQIYQGLWSSTMTEHILIKNKLL